MAAKELAISEERGSACRSGLNSKMSSTTKRASSAGLMNSDFLAVTMATAQHDIERTEVPLVVRNENRRSDSLSENTDACRKARGDPIEDASMTSRHTTGVEAGLEAWERPGVRDVAVTRLQIRALDRQRGKRIEVNGLMSLATY